MIRIALLILVGMLSAQTRVTPDQVSGSQGTQISLDQAIKLCAANQVSVSSVTVDSATGKVAYILMGFAGFNFPPGSRDPNAPRIIPSDSPCVLYQTTWKPAN